MEEGKIFCYRNCDLHNNDKDLGCIEKMGGIKSWAEMVSDKDNLDQNRKILMSGIDIVIMLWYCDSNHNMSEEENVIKVGKHGDAGQQVDQVGLDP